MIFFTADQHYGSRRALDFSKRPFRTTRDMDAEMIEKFNSIVSDDDVTYHIGDFGKMYVINKLNGEHHLIIGNYEVDEMNAKKPFKKGGFPAYKRYLMEEVGFKSVQYVKKLALSDNNIILNLVHKPEDCVKDDPNVFNLFGHIHGRQMIKRYGLDVGVDGHHFYPVSLEDVMFYMDAIYNHYDENVFE